jgi:hypothetical protein
MSLDKIADGIMSLLLKINGTESLLHRYQGYRSNSCVVWKRGANMDWRIFWKIIKKIEILDSQRIRSIIIDIVAANPQIFDGTCYVAAFGKVGKSGEVIMYEFNHCISISESRLVKVSDLPSLPSHSKIVFVEDLIGTGTQSIGYITNRLNLLLNPSHIPYLLALCATPEAVEKVQENSNFTVLAGIQLSEEEYQHYSKASSYFSPAEKVVLNNLNGLLKDPSKFDYDRGLLLSFYYAIPNNSMPMLWKEGYKYKDQKGRLREWFGLLPREF